MYANKITREKLLKFTKMTEFTVLNEIFDKYREAINTERHNRWVIKKTCKQIRCLTLEISNVLEIILEENPCIDLVCLKARELFEKVRQLFLQIQNHVPTSEYYRYHYHWRKEIRQCCYQILVTIWLETGALGSLAAVANILGIETDETKDFYLDLEDYLLGILNLCSELKQMAVKSAARGEYGHIRQITKFVIEINTGFRLLSLKNGYLRRRFDGLKYDVNKLTEIFEYLYRLGLINAVGHPVFSYKLKDKDKKNDKPKVDKKNVERKDSKKRTKKKKDDSKDDDKKNDEPKDEDMKNDETKDSKKRIKKKKDDSKDDDKKNDEPKDEDKKNDEPKDEDKKNDEPKDDDKKIDEQKDVA